MRMDGQTYLQTDRQTDRIATFLTRLNNVSAVSPCTSQRIGAQIYLFSLAPTPFVGPLNQCFSTAGPRPGTELWHKLYLATRDSPGIDN